MEIDFALSHNPTLLGSLSVSPPTSMFDSFSPLLHLNDDFFDALNPINNNDDDDNVEDWIKPLLFDQSLDNDLQSNSFNLNNIDIKDVHENEKSTNCLSTTIENELKPQQTIDEYKSIDFFPQQSSEQQLPIITTSRSMHQPKIELNEIPRTLYLSGNEFQYRPLITRNIKTSGTTIAQSDTTSSIGSVPIPTSLSIVPAQVLKGKKFKRAGRNISRTTSRTSAAAKRRLNSTGVEPKASVVIIAEDATQMDSKATTLGLSSTNKNDTDQLKSSSTNSTRRRIKARAPREVILFRNGTFISKEPISKQQSLITTKNNSSSFHQEQITTTGLQAAAQIVACNVLRQATLTDALIEQLIKREPTKIDDESAIYCYLNPCLSSSSSMTTSIDDCENNCSTTMKILGCNTTASLTSANTTTIELLTLAALEQQQQFYYIKQEPVTTTCLLPLQ